MPGVVDLLRGRDPERRQAEIVDVLVNAFADLMAADPAAFRRRFRKMAADPFAFYRGSACLFYADMARDEDPWADERTGRVWIHGDLHAENFGTYMDAEGVLVFDVNDFDEAYLGHFTWDIKRLAASVALLSWTKAISDTDIDGLIETYARAYVAQVSYFAGSDRDHAFSLRLETTTGPVHEVLQQARRSTRVGLLEAVTLIEGHERRFSQRPGVRRLGDAERATVEAAFARYLDTIPAGKRFNSLTYRVKDVVGRSGFGIGSAGLSAFNILVEGRTQALENDVVLSMKQGNIAAPSRIVDDQDIRDYFQHHGHRTAVSQRALQAHADPWLGHTDLAAAGPTSGPGPRQVGYVVGELSPYTADLDWSALTEPWEMAPVLDLLGRATAKIHCVSDEDSDHKLIEFQTEDAIATSIEANGGEMALVRAMVEFGVAYAQVARDDHRLFVDAFRNGQIPGVESSARVHL
ncbi:MAG: DUF2252 domain-containing protein [Carbonactinosporaceae bacterium]